MKIIIVRDEIDKSEINEEPIKELPEGLFEQMKHLLSSMSLVKKIYIKAEKPEDSIFDVTDRNATLTDYEKERKEFLEVINLYLWYKKKHWDNNHVLNNHYKCIDCDLIVQSPSYPKNLYCPNIECFSHKNWQKVIGSLYKLPETTSNTA